MNRAKQIVASLCVVGAVATAAGLGWLSERLIPVTPSARFGYMPDPGSGISNDLASIQKGWPQSLDTPAERKQFATFLGAMEDIEPPPLTGTVAVRTPSEPVDLGMLLTQAAVETGVSKARVCQSCHDFSPDGRDRIGPNLWGVVGRRIGTKPGYAFSSAMSSKSETWTYERLFEFLGSPGRAIPGTKMSFAGIRRPEDRAAVIRYLSILGPNAPAFPQPASIEATPVNK